jgi:hypothetical protein
MGRLVVKAGLVAPGEIILHVEPSLSARRRHQEHPPYGPVPGLTVGPPAGRPGEPDPGEAPGLPVARRLDDHGQSPDTRPLVAETPPSPSG